MPSSPNTNGPVLPMNCSAKDASSLTFVPSPGVSFGVSIVRAETLPSSFFTRCTVTSPPSIPGALAVSSPSIGAAGAASVWPSASAGPSAALSDADSSAAGSRDLSPSGTILLSASRTAPDVTDAPVIASMPSCPYANGAILPMNWLVKLLSEAVFPRPSVSSGVSMVNAATELSAFRRTVTVTSPPNPFTVVETGSADCVPPPSMIVFNAVITAVDVYVAPERASIPSSP